jgi:hypothetical protein
VVGIRWTGAGVLTDMSRSLVPLLALVLGVGSGWMWGSASAPELPPPPEVCDPEPVQEQVKAALLELHVAQAEFNGGW